MTSLAAIEAVSHHVEGAVAERKFPAIIWQFRTVEAEAALIVDGCRLGMAAQHGWR